MELRRAEEDVRKGKAFGEGMFRERMRMAENEKAEMRNEVSGNGGLLKPKRTLLNTDGTEGLIV